MTNNDRACTEVQRPTEEWGGIMLQPQISKEVTNVHRSHQCDENEEMQEINESGANIQIGEFCKTSQNGNHSGVKEGSRTQSVQRGIPEQGSGFDPAEAVSSVASKNRNSRTQPEEFLDKNCVLDISYL